MLESVLNIALLVLGFGFVIFWHELGHFLAAKWADVRVEQFAVGFGHALLSWRKGLGFTPGSSAARLERLAAEGVDISRYGETEYRLNWIPLGGYVKMLGQDDLKPNAVAEDPRAYNKKSIGKRMVIVSAGVVMNVLLAGIGFMVLFLIGFNAPPTVVGGIAAGSPAQAAGLEVGDRILSFDGRPQLDFTKITLYPALVSEGQTVPITVRRADGQEQTLQITPRRPGRDSNEFLRIGIEPPRALKGLKVRDFQAIKGDWNTELLTAGALAVAPGDTIVAVDGEGVGEDDYYKLDHAVQASGGQPVKITIRDAKGDQRIAQVEPHFARSFDGDDLAIAGLIPRVRVETVLPNSPARGKILPGDVVESAKMGTDLLIAPTTSELMQALNKAGEAGQAVELTVLRQGESVTVEPIIPSLSVGKGRRGMGIGLGYDERHAVVAGVQPASAAASLQIPKNSRLVSINGQDVSTWFDVREAMAKIDFGQSMKIVAQTPRGSDEQFTLTLPAESLAAIRDMRYTTHLMLGERIEVRKTSNPLTAAAWGAIETRDFILQFYLTLQRMFTGDISHKNLMGPLGIFDAGTKFAYKGTDWLIWFLAMISANLAVVNFLPIPIVDGGLFTFLLIEKIKGKPLSPRAQSIAQVIGMALILGVFLLVTYQDIARMMGRS